MIRASFEYTRAEINCEESKMGEGALAARRLVEGTPSPRNFDRGSHRRLL